MHPKSIGQFQIQRELGRGGMGVVFLATDTRLDRQVAIKSLPADLAADPDRLARFQREAKLLASLNHPNVGAIHGLEQADGHQYLVLEYIEGETLADRLARGPVPVDEALTLAKQIAEALEVAHDKGIVHRDLKPGNVMVTADGVVKVLDFGLARTADGDPTSSSGAALANSPTITSPPRHSPPRHSPTIPGAIMGTAGYMSPEQARGKPVDKRSDIFSFGCVLYEMLSGAGPFSGETVTDSLGAILHRDPNWLLLPTTTPPRVRELLANCLAKDRKNRTHDIGDARLEIERTIAGHGGPSTVAQAATGKPSWPALIGTALVAILLAGAAGWLLASELLRPAMQAPPQVLHLSTAVPAKPQLREIVGIAPDAQFVLYAAWTDPELDSTKPQGVLVVRRLDRDKTTVIEGTEGARAAALSPDGRWLAFSAVRDRAGSKVSLKKIALDDGRPVGAPETLCDLPTGGSATLCWSSDREIVIALPWNETILAVSSAGGEPRVVLQEARGKEIDSWGDIRSLVEGQSILASRWSLVGQTIKERIEVVDLISGKRTPLLQNASLAQYTTGGLLVARRNVRTLIAARLDLDTLQVVGEPVTVWNGDPIGGFLVSRSGTLALTTESGDFSKRKLARVDDQGKLQAIAAPARSYGNSIAVSPDGARVATVLEPTDFTDLPAEIWVYDLARGTSIRIPTDGPCIECAWSRDGQRITFTTVEKDGFAIWERRADGSGERTKLYTSASPQVLSIPLNWSPDGKVLAFLSVDLSKQATDVWMLEQAADTTEWVAKPYLDSSANEQSLAFSPDGKWVRFASDEAGGRSDLYVQRFTGAGSGAADSRSGRVQIPTGGNGSGWLSSDGKEFRYVDPDDQVMSVQVQTEPTFTASAPKLLYSIKDLKTKARTIAPDGQLIVVLEGEDERANRIGVVVNFLDAARAQLSAAK